jgi:hypothetical protein
MNSNIFLYEEDSNLTIPLEGRSLKIDYRDDMATTVLDTGEQQIVLNGRSLNVAYQSVLDET